MSSQISPCSQGFVIKPTHITYTARTEVWAKIACLLHRMDSEAIPNENDRIIFELLRDSIGNAVQAAVGQSWLEPAALANVELDVGELIQ